MTDHDWPSNGDEVEVTLRGRAANVDSLHRWLALDTGDHTPVSEIHHAHIVGIKTLTPSWVCDGTVILVGKGFPYGERYEGQVVQRCGDDDGGKWFYPRGRNHSAADDKRWVQFVAEGKATVIHDASKGA